MKNQVKPTFDIRRTPDTWLCSIEIGSMVICFTSVAPYEQVRREAYQQLQRAMLAEAA